MRRNLFPASSLAKTNASTSDMSRNGDRLTRNIVLMMLHYRQILPPSVKQKGFLRCPPPDRSPCVRGLILHLSLRLMTLQCRPKNHPHRIILVRILLVVVIPVQTRVVTRVQMPSPMQQLSPIEN